MVLPELTLRQTDHLFTNTLTDAVAHTLVEREDVRVHLLDLPAFLVLAGVDKHNKREDLFTAVVGADKGM